METRLSMNVIQSYAKCWFHLKNDCLILFSSTVTLHIYYNWKTVIFVLEVSCFIQFGIRGMPWYCVSSQNYDWHIVNPLHATGLFLLLLKNIRKPEGFRCFQELQKKTLGMKWVSAARIIRNDWLVRNSLFHNVEKWSPIL